MADPAQLRGGDHTVFVAGNDMDAKATVIDLLASMDWADILDLGDLIAARYCEMLVPLWQHLAGVMHAPTCNIKIVR